MADMRMAVTKMSSFSAKPCNPLTIKISQQRYEAFERGAVRGHMVYN